MAHELKKKTKGRLDLTPKQMRERFKNYQSKYRKAHLLSKSTGFGLTENDKRKGINSVSEKLKSLCPFFYQMDDLFGKKANITPLAQFDAQQSDSIHDEEGYPKDASLSPEEMVDWPESNVDCEAQPTFPSPHSTPPTSKSSVPIHPSLLSSEQRVHPVNIPPILFLSLPQILTVMP